MVWSEGNMSVKNTVTPPGIDPGTVRLAVQRRNHYPTPGPTYYSYVIKALVMIKEINYLKTTVYSVGEYRL